MELAEVDGFVQAWRRPVKVKDGGADPSRPTVGAVDEAFSPAILTEVEDVRNKEVFEEWTAEWNKVGFEEWTAEWNKVVPEDSCVGDTDKFGQ